MSYTTWLKGLPIGWLYGGTNGQAEANAQGTIFDNNADRVKAAVKARFPDYAPDSATLGHIGGDRGLIQGPNESDANFKIRLKYAFDDWARAGCFLELLAQLYWQGYDTAVIAQQNGLAFNLSGAPTAGQDPSGLLVITNLTTLNAPGTSDIDLNRSIPQFSSWWFIDNNTDFCSRFEILLPTQPATWSGGNPSASALGVLKSIVRAWRPAGATCIGVTAYVSGGSVGRFNDWPVTSFSTYTGHTFADVEATVNRIQVM